MRTSPVTSTRKNILVFLTDDHGQWASRIYGNPELHTPTMDWIGETGACFENAFTPCPVCSPARASFWTGLIPSAHGIHDHIGNREHPGVDGFETLAMRLRALGYRTGLCGKWHCHAHGDKPQPGFDYWFSQWGGTKAVAGEQPFSENGERRDLQGQQAPLITDAALRFLRRDTGNIPTEDQPFFLFVGFSDTHAPFATLPERLVNHYRKAAFAAIPDETPAAHLPPREPGDYFGRMSEPEAAREALAQYYASVSMIDEQMGRLIDELEGMGALEDTLIVYTGDHGHMNGHHGLVTKGNASVPVNFYEESIRIPMLVRLPGEIAPGTRCPEPVDLCDLHSTLRDRAGDPQTSPRLGPGRSLRQLWAVEAANAEQAPPWRDFQCVEYGSARMIRDRAGHKLVRRRPCPHGAFPDEFYDLARDPRETENRIDDPACQNLIAELDETLRKFHATHADPAREGLRATELPPPNAQPAWEGRRAARPESSPEPRSFPA